MVMKLPLPAPCSVGLVDALVKERQNGVNAKFFSNIADEWRARVQGYLDDRGNPEAVPAWPQIALHRKSFVNLYAHPAEHSVQYPILERLRDRTLQVCPGCGEEGTPNTLDHYLPKESYPHFAVTPANLAPMCDICQGFKGVDTTDETGARMFIHPYFDDVAADQVLRLVIGRPLVAPEDFVIEADLDLPDGVIALIQRHISGLQIQRRYGHFFREEYIRLLRLAQNSRQEGTDIRVNLPMFKQFHQQRGRNAWPHLFYSAVLEDEELLIFLAKGDLPALL
jgi:5-methylcytosine-specific restriction endonuclease McrA